MKSIWKDGTKFVLLAAALATGVGIGCATARQPHMENALDALRTARSELVASTPNKGGHRARALRLIDDAISEVRSGINYAD
jgi:hypothetical protein